MKLLLWDKEGRGDRTPFNQGLKGARCAWEPYVTRHVAKSKGEIVPQQVIQARIAQHPGFLALKDTILQLCLGTAGDLALHIWCRQGRHRSS